MLSWLLTWCAALFSICYGLTSQITCCNVNLNIKLGFDYFNQVFFAKDSFKALCCLMLEIEVSGWYKAKMLNIHQYNASSYQLFIWLAHIMYEYFHLTYAHYISRRSKKVLQFYPIFRLSAKFHVHEIVNSAATNRNIFQFSVLE